MTITTPEIVYRSYDPAIAQEISFRPVSLEQDLARIHDWMNQPHVIPFWKLNFSQDKMKAHLEKALADTHQTLYIGLLNGVPMSYWESYWATEDIVGNYYPVDANDQGIHLLIGPPEFLGQGYALPLLRAMTAFQFQQPATQKVVTEPDIRNHKMIHIFKRCGFSFQKAIDLPDKQGAFMVCDRAEFNRRWNRHV